jgi:hypothetical protein
VFERPVDHISSLHITLPASAVGETGEFQFLIPWNFIGGNPQQPPKDNLAAKAKADAEKGIFDANASAELQALALQRQAEAKAQAAAAEAESAKIVAAAELERAKIAAAAAVERAKIYAKLRAEAEAAAAAKNKANQEAYEKEVMRLKEEHALRVEKHRAAVEAYNEEVLAYKKAKTEIEAAKKLEAAKPPPLASKNLVEVCRRKAQDIIDNYPDTQAAADAKTFLKSGFVPSRKIPPEPTRPGRRRYRCPHWCCRRPPQ